jgi:hypothetical protein
MDRLKSWFGFAFMGVMIAALFAAVPFWTHGLTVKQATVAAAVIFPLVLIAYSYAIWREGRRG